MGNRVDRVALPEVVQKDDTAEGGSNDFKKAGEKKLFKKWNEEKELKILIVGKEGSGKCTLIDGIIGDDVAKEKVGAFSSTLTVTKKTIGCVPVTLYNSVGLHDCYRKDRGFSEHIHQLRHECKKLNLVLYCLNMTYHRFSLEEFLVMEKLTEAFGESFWDYVVFVLTFANRENVECHNGMDMDDKDDEPDFNDNEAWKKLTRERFKNRIEYRKTTFQNILIEKIQIDSNIAKNVPVVPVGYTKPTRMCKNPFHLPDRDNWLYSLWETCSLRLENPSLLLQLLNGENFMEVDRGNLDRAIQEGYIDCNIHTAVVQGEARAGKTSVKSLLLSLPYDELSTSCIESPQVAVKNEMGSFSVNRFGRLEKRWTFVKEDEMNEKVMAEVRYVALHPGEVIQKTLESKAIASNQQTETNIMLEMPTASESLPADPLSSEDAALFSSNDNIDHSSAIPIAQHHSPINEKEYEKTTKKVGGTNVTGQFFERFNEISSEVKLSIHTDWLHLIDSGGQIQFQKLLPAFMPCTSVLLLVINLAHQFSDPSSTVMQLQNKKVQVDDYSLPIKDVLKHLLSAVASSAQYHRTMIIDDPLLSKFIEPPAENLNVIAIATHYDELNVHESLAQKEVTLNLLSQSMKNKCTIVRNEEPPYNIMHIVDGLKAKKAEFDDPNIEYVANKLSDQAYKIKVPLKWYCLMILLREEAKASFGVLTVASCKDMGKQLHIEANEVLTSLKFFHILNMLLYYPNSSNDDDDLVFIRIESLIDIIKELMSAICSVRDNWEAAPDDVKELATEGYLSKQVLKRSKMFSNLVKAFHPSFESKLMSLLIDHLLIAARLPEEGYYFMPALLPVKKISNSSSDDPLLFYFDDIIPIGLLCAIIVQLLSLHGENTDSQWHIVRHKKHPNFSNSFTLQKDQHMYILVETIDCIQVHGKFPDYQAVVEIKRAIELTTKKRKYDVALKMGFICSDCSSSSEQHVALVLTNKEDSVLYCQRTKVIHSMDKTRKSWFEYTGKRIKTLSEQIKRRPTHKDLVSQLSGISSKWYELGVQFEVMPDDLASLKHSNVSDQFKLSHVIKKWEDRNINVTWGTVLDIVSSSAIGNNDLRMKIEKFLESEFDENTDEDIKVSTTIKHSVDHNVEEQSKEQDSDNSKKTNKSPKNLKQVVSPVINVEEGETSQPQLTDEDLINCSHHIRDELLYDLCEYLNIDDEVMDKFKKRRTTTQAQALALLKEWRKRNSTTCTNLKKNLKTIFNRLKMETAAESLL